MFEGWLLLTSVPAEFIDSAHIWLISTWLLTHYWPYGIFFMLPVRINPIWMRTFVFSITMKLVILWMCLYLLWLNEYLMMDLSRLFYVVQCNAQGHTVTKCLRIHSINELHVFSVPLQRFFFPINAFVAKKKKWDCEMLFTGQQMTLYSQV